jgi:hypothetical protein
MDGRRSRQGRTRRSGILKALRVFGNDYCVGVSACLTADQALGHAQLPDTPRCSQRFALVFILSQFLIARAR